MTKIKRPIRICGDVAYVPLTQGYEAIIDAADAPLVEGHNWNAHKNGNTVYAKRRSGAGVFLLHRVIMEAPCQLSVDHIDGDGLNNMRCNMRLATHAQNMKNRRINCNSTSGFKGIYFNKQSGKWMARIRFNEKSNYLGLFALPEEAYAAYCAASKKYHGEFGRTE
tara:strand:+ start:423 stop:920 length:498 start_codon:yes stop_codon:yes gene_type:complete